MSDQLKEKTVSGLKWSGVERIFTQVFVFIAGILLARKLLETDYGMAGVLTIFTYMANALQNSGFPTALIRKKDANEADYNTVFYFNIVVALILYLVLFILAPYISDFYHEPQLTALARFAFLTFLFNAFSSIQSVQVIKKLNFKLNTKINISSTFFSYCVALILAYNNFGPWAIVSQVVSLAGFQAVMLWLSSHWRPQWIFSTKSFKELFAFGSNLLLRSILDTIITRITPSVVGKYYGFADTGSYSQGNKFYSSGVDVIGGLCGVSYPVLSTIDNEKRLKKIFRKLVRFYAFIIVPFFLGMALVARPFVLGVLGIRWANAIPILQMLAIGGIFYSLNVINEQMINIKNKPVYLLIFEIVRIFLVFIFIGLTLFFHKSYLYIILGMVIINVISYIFNSCVVYRFTNYCFKEHVKDLFPYVALASFAIVVGYYSTSMIENMVLLLIARILVVAMVYLGSTYLMGSTIIKEAFVFFKLKKMKVE